ncbi:MAG TPA: hypothetical protein VGF14_00285 [Alphaproteobacteria bacterium]
MPRIFPILFCLLLVTLTIRIGDIMVEAITGGQGDHYMSEAQAQEKTAKDEPADAPAVEKTDAAKADEKTVVKDSTKDKVLKENYDPFAPQFSDEELSVLQSLSERRKQLDQRERDLEQRDKLLQAAEKKVEQKVAELNALKGEMEKLLGQQQQAASQSTKQLVRIYESMKPKDAANIFNDMEGDILLKIIGTMSERKSAPILAAMDPAKARDISSKIAAQKALPEKDPIAPTAP